MSRRVFLVRHCESQANAEGRIEGKGDSALSDKGLAQAARVAAFIASHQIGEAILIASSQMRSHQTALAIGEACGWTHIQDHRIREGELGWMEDLSYVEVGRHMREKGHTELDHHVHGGESLEEVGARLWEALEEAMAGNEDVVILVSHGYAIQALLRRIDPDVAIPRFVGNGDVVELMLDGEAFAEPPRHHPLEPASA